MNLKGSKIEFPDGSSNIYLRALENEKRTQSSKNNIPDQVRAIFEDWES